MYSFLELAAFRLYFALRAFKNESGQTTAEYVAVTAVAVALAVGVIFAVLGGSLGDAIDNISSWIEGAAPDDPPPIE